MSSQLIYTLFSRINPLKTLHHTISLNNPLPTINAITDTIIRTRNFCKLNPQLFWNCKIVCEQINDELALTACSQSKERISRPEAVFASTSRLPSRRNFLLRDTPAACGVETSPRRLRMPRDKKRKKYQGSWLRGNSIWNEIKPRFHRGKCRRPNLSAAGRTEQGRVTTR